MRVNVFVQSDTTETGNHYEFSSITSAGVFMEYCAERAVGNRAFVVTFDNKVEIPESRFFKEEE